MTTDKLNLVKNSVSESLGQLYQARHHVGCLKDEDEGIIFDDIANLQTQTQSLLSKLTKTEDKKGKNQMEMTTQSLLSQLSKLTEKCPRRTERKITEKGYLLYEGSTIMLPPGTEFDIFVNQDPDDPTSDTMIETVLLTTTTEVSVILTEPISVKDVEN